MAVEHKNKAQEIIDDFYFNIPLMHYKDAVLAALKSVELIIKSNPTDVSCVDVTFTYAYWIKIKNEIVKIKSQYD
jgi:ABC-type oligopeptide transport system substrate-binding subunit